jgi:raffinose/stachyose/melibiose transport system permease protein
VVVAYPTISGLYYSLTDWKGISQEINFIGFRNYRRLFDDRIFFTSIKNTLLIAAVVVVGQNATALLLAVALNKKLMPGKNFFRIMFFIPSLLSAVVMGYTWLYILNVHTGIVGMALRTFNVENIFKYDIFTNPTSALLGIALTLVWQFTGYSMVIYLAGLQTIQQELYEAADIDGAGAFQKFRCVTIPLLVPSITVSTFLILVGCLKIFEQPYVLTKGGPGSSTETIGTFIYNSAFSGLQMGYGTAISTVLFIGILIVTTVQLKFFRKLEIEL